jgi:hypothetical protein
MAFKNTPSVPGEEMGRQLSVKSFGWSKSAILEKLFENKKEDVFLMRVIGSANGTKPYQSRTRGDDGEYLEGHGIIGQFECTGPDGEVKPGNKIYLPGYITEAIVGHLQGNPDVSVRCAFDLYARYDEASATSYVFVGRSLIQQESDELKQLKARLSSTPLPTPAALPAPK